MKQTIILMAGLALLAGCTEPEPATSREPASALQADPTDRPFLVDAPSYQVAEAIRSAALEVRSDSALFLATAMDAELAAEEDAARPGEHIAAHPAFPFHALLRLSHRDTGATTQVRAIEPGPFLPTREPMDPDPVLAISPDAARALGIGPGEEGHVWVVILEW